MCGIVGMTGHRDVQEVLLEGLRRLEYRGYDSAGMALVDSAGHLTVVRRAGKIKELELALAKNHQSGHVGIAHTRWATHGIPSERNAHPHLSHEHVAVVHNGIIENHETLRQSLQDKGYVFRSDTDTECIVHLVHWYMQQGADLLSAVRLTCSELQGAYALCVISQSEPDRIIAARSGSPLVIGLGSSEHFVASDVYALVGETQRFIYLEENDIVELTPESVRISNGACSRVERPVHETRLIADAVERGVYRHYMQKEIHEQPVAISRTLEGRVRNGRLLDDAIDASLKARLASVNAVQIVACGTSYHAGLVAKYWLESIAGVVCSVEVASEFRYRKHVVIPGTLFVAISQSGETADTLAALRGIKDMNYLHTLAICNVAESSIVRATESMLMTRAGPEVGVASTKAFTTQLAALLILVLALAKQKGLSAEDESRYVRELETLPQQIKQVLKLEPEIEQWAERFGDKRHSLYLGRGVQYPVALEGALKLKEISYIHAEAYPAGELKHGPLALIDDEMPVVAVAPNNELLEKLKSNLQEVHARGGVLYVFADTHVPMETAANVNILRVAATEDVIAPIIYTIPLQMLAYHVALIKGTDVDQPRNLAKSVTVE
ncbi:MAG: glutamine--fructose-6-phosphate transaminase (isomerizing) [Methylococcaceae bacterium]